MASIPYTERSNAITENIDVSSPLEMVQLLRQTDRQIFEGAATEVPNLFSDDTVHTMTDLAGFIRDTLSCVIPEDVAIVLAGCGTSGRLAYMISKIFNELTANKLGVRPFSYSIAGGDKSILTSQEAPEDDPNAGVNSLLEICRDKKKVTYIAITCGLSAPFVGGQLEYCMNHLETFTPVLLGFNPTHMARNVAITGWNKTMLDVVAELQRLSKENKAFIVNPVVGAEAITGSSRMKGGSATKIILEAIFLSALNALETQSKEKLTPQTITATLKLYQDICRNFYESNACDVMTNLIQRCGYVLKDSGEVRYLASGWMGVIPLIDSTECPPTFGSSVNDVRGFVDGGYNLLGIKDFGKENKNFRLGFTDFVDMYKDGDVGNDTVIAFIQSNTDPILSSLRQDLGTTLQRIKGNNNTVAVVLERPADVEIVESSINPFFDEVLKVQLPEYNYEECGGWGSACKQALEDSLYGCCLKWMVNAASTGGHILLGKVYKNYMCDVKVSNNKLYHRSIGIIKILCPEVSDKIATDSLLKSIYETDEITDAIRDKPVSEHYKIASSKDKVVPLAIILAKMDIPVKCAKETLEKHSVIRNAVLEVTGK